MRIDAPSGLFLAAFVPLLAAVSSQLCAQEGETRSPEPRLDVDLSYGQTDNVGRNSSEIRSDITTLGLAFTTGAARPRLDAQIVGDVDWTKYGAEAVIDNQQLIGSIDGSMSIAAVPDVFVWDFMASHGQTRTDPLAPVGPNNREQTRVTTTGPRVTIRVGERNHLEIVGRTSDRNYDRSRYLDGRVNSANLDYIHDIDTVTSVSIAVSTRKTKYDSGAQPYDYRSLAVRYAREFSTGGVELSLGRGEVEVGGLKDPTTVGRLAWDRGIASRSRLRLWISRDYTDTGELFRAGGLPVTSNVPLSTVPGAGSAADSVGSDALNTNDVRLNDVTLSVAPSLRSTKGLQISLNGRRTDIGVSLEIANDEFVGDTTRDSDLRLLSMSVNHEFGPVWRMNVGMTVADEKFVTVDTRNKDRYGRVALTRSLGRQSSLSVALLRNRRNSGVARFHENEYSVSFGHSFTH